MSEQLKATVTEWIELKKNLASARKDIQVISRREKDLAEEIKSLMIEHDVDDLKVQDKKIRLRRKIVKASITKNVIQNGLNVFFSGDELKVNTVIKVIAENAPSTERTTLLLSGVTK
jgi:CBS-domain-containing membrane protein